MKGLILRWLLTMVAVWVAAYLIPGISYVDWKSLAIAALVLGILNAILKPILLLISLPLLLLTLGLFLFIINGILLKLTDVLVSGFEVQGWFAAIAGALIISVMNMLFGNKRDD
ncbi:MAG: phage holin family protein [Verrucomicrobiota bacterium]